MRGVLSLALIGLMYRLFPLETVPEQTIVQNAFTPGLSRRPVFSSFHSNLLSCCKRLSSIEQQKEESFDAMTVVGYLMLLAGLLSPHAVQAAVEIRVCQDGPDVLTRMRGTLDITDFVFTGTGSSVPALSITDAFAASLSAVTTERGVRQNTNVEGQFDQYFLEGFNNPSVTVSTVSQTHSTTNPLLEDAGTLTGNSVVATSIVIPATSERITLRLPSGFLNGGTINGEFRLAARTWASLNLVDASRHLRGIQIALPLSLRKMFALLPAKLE